VSQIHGSPACDFVVGLRLEDRIARELLGAVERAFQVRAFDQEIVHQQLPPHVDRDHRRRVVQVRHGHRFGRFHPEMLGRPDRGQTDAVVQQFARVLRPGFGRGDSHILESGDQSEFPQLIPLARLHPFLVDPRAVDGLVAEQLKERGLVDAREPQRFEFLAPRRTVLVRLLGDHQQRTVRGHANPASVDPDPQKLLPAQPLRALGHRVSAIREQLDIRFERSDSLTGSRSADHRDLRTGVRRERTGGQHAQQRRELKNACEVQRKTLPVQAISKRRHWMKFLPLFLVVRGVRENTVNVVFRSAKERTF
jgi:hypothetical protein